MHAELTTSGPRIGLLSSRRHLMFRIPHLHVDLRQGIRSLSTKRAAQGLYADALVGESRSPCTLHCVYRIVRIESHFALIRLQWVSISQPHPNHRTGGKLGRVACEAAASALTCVWLNSSRRSFEKGYPYLFCLVATLCNGLNHTRGA